MTQLGDSLVIEGYRLACVHDGEGPPILFVHGSMSDHRTWTGQLAHFGLNWRATAYSRRYHWPNEPVGPHDDYAMDQQVSDLAAVVSQLGIAPARLVGHSYGGFLCLLLAMRHPELVRSMVLAEPPVIPLAIGAPPNPVRLLTTLITRPRLGFATIGFASTGLFPATAAIRSGDRERVVSVFGKAVLGPASFHALREERLRRIKDNLIAAEFLGSGFAPLDQQVVRQVRQPVLLLVGEHSPGLFWHLSKRLNELLPSSRLQTISCASHIAHEDNPTAFNSTIEHFLHDVDNLSSSHTAQSGA